MPQLITRKRAIIYCRVSSDKQEQEQILNIEATIAFAKQERGKYAEGSYMYNLISQDIPKQEAQLARYKEEIGSGKIEKAAGSWQQRIMDFVGFLNVMRGRIEISYSPRFTIRPESPTGVHIS